MWTKLLLLNITSLKNKNNENRELAGWLLCCWKHFHPSSCHGPLHELKNYTLTSSANQFLLLIVETQQKNYSPPMALTSPSFLVDSCVFLAALGKMTQKLLVFCDNFVWKLVKYRELTLFFTPKYAPCLLHSVIIKGVRDRSWQGQKWPCFSCRWIKIWKFTHSMNLSENEYFLGNWLLSNRRQGAPCHDSGKVCCIVRIDGRRIFHELFWTGFGDPLVTKVFSLFCNVLFSLCSVMQVH